MFFFTSGFDHHRGHNHADQNSFAFFAHGEEFLIDPPLIPKATECHNTVIIDGIGQTMPSRGEIVKFEDRGDSFFVSGDATEAYEWLSLLVGYARRNVLYVKGEVPYLVTFDDIQTEDDKEKTYSYMVHTGLDNVMEIKQDDIWIVGKSGATCRVRICSPKELKLSISDLSGKTVFRYVSQHKLADYYQEAKVDTVAKNPKFIAVITAAKDNAHPEVDIEHSKDRSIVTLTFRSGRIDKILVTKEDIKII
jgi:hypothetical protein